MGGGERHVAHAKINPMWVDRSPHHVVVVPVRVT
jgi:hypothetical protein